MPAIKNDSRHESPKNISNEVEQRKLNAIASSIDKGIFDKQEAIHVDRFGHVNIHPNHPDYEYWLKEDD